jgi:GT2 family glycosyltransferase
MRSAPIVSVVIPTYNRLPQLRLALAALAQQTYAADCFEVVVVSDGSTDGTDTEVPVMDSPFDLVFASQSNAGPAAARNRGIAQARGSIIVFMDDDVTASPALVARHVRAHEGAGQEVVVIGPMLNPPDFTMSPWVHWQQRMLYRQYDAMAAGQYEPTFRQFYTGNASVSRPCLLDSGGFDIRYRRSEDVELAYRLAQAGLRFVLDPEAIGFHYADRSYDAWLDSARDYGANDVAFARDHGRREVLTVVADEFQRRNALVRWTARACVAQRWFRPLFETGMKGVVKVADGIGLQRLTQFALSGLFNCAYYAGMADELGGSGPFHRTMLRPGADY